MRTELGGPAVARARVEVRPTAAGVAIIGLGCAALFMSSSARLAVGFMVPLVVAIAIDLYLSWHVVSRRTVSVGAPRTVAHIPNGIALRLDAPAAHHPVRVNIVSSATIEASLSLGDDPAHVELYARHPTATNYLRCETSATIFGLGSARRWETHSVPMLHWAPEPRNDGLAVPDAIDEVARLRAYVPGDRMSRVSWPVTARTGQMHVRAAGAGHEEFVVVLNLLPDQGDRGEGAYPLDPDQPLTSDEYLIVLEHTLALTATFIAQLLDDGHDVRLISTELTQERFDTVRTSARANPRAEATPERSALDATIVDRYVLDGDDLARRMALAEVGQSIAWPNGSYVDVSMLGLRTMP